MSNNALNKGEQEMDKFYTSGNKQHGFYGTLKSTYSIKDDTASKCFNIMAQILVAHYGVTEDTVVSFLDSRPARHLVDTIRNFYRKNALESIVLFTAEYRSSVRDSLDWFFSPED
jgi:hypothetical protein